MNLKKTLFIAIPVVAVLTLLVFGGNEKKDTRKTQAQSSQQTKPKTSATPLSELEEIKSGLDREGILSAIGTGESTSEMIARNIAADNARTELARSVAGQTSSVVIRGSTVHKSITRYNAKNNVYRVYSLITAREVIPQ
ncbi:MAG: hypothetical protein LBU70_03520 [Chitinispirillales bacterium]|jgi:hypothetical protein|nr:hypothetical protein [Chitinispirillales bacterium]